MALTQAQIVDFLYKKIGYVIAKTGAETGSGSLGVTKGPTAEAIGSPLVVPASSVWADSASIPFNAPPASTSGVISVYPTTAPLQMTADSSITGGRTWFATTTFNDATTRVGDWIDPGNFGAQYLVKIYKGPLSGGSVQTANQLFPGGSGSNDSWFFDYSNGVLNFGDTNVPTGVNGGTLYLVGYRYTGTKGVGGGGGGSLTIQDEGSSQGTATTLNFTGAGVQATVSSGTATINVTGGGGGSAITVQDEGSNIGTAATTFNFVGAGVQATYGSGITTVTFSGGGGSIAGINTTGTSIFNHLDVSGVGTFFSGNLRIKNPFAFEYSIVGSTIVANRTLTLPALSANDTFAVLNLSQTFGATQTFNDLSGTGSFSWTGNTNTNFSINTSSVTGSITIGGAGGTGNIVLGQSSSTQITNIQAGATLSGNTKTINIGTGGQSGSNTQINIGSSTGNGTITINNNVNALGVITATAFVGDGSGLTGVVAVGSGVVIQDDGSPVGTASTINFGTNLTASVSNGVATINGSGGGGGVSNSTAIAYAIALS
jgi:hypothetical protein